MTSQKNYVINPSKFYHWWLRPLAKHNFAKLHPIKIPSFPLHTVSYVCLSAYCRIAASSRFDVLKPGLHLQWHPSAACFLSFISQLLFCCPVLLFYATLLTSFPCRRPVDDPSTLPFPLQLPYWEGVENPLGQCSSFDFCIFLDREPILLLFT
jgi:hypothetical protein